VAIISSRVRNTLALLFLLAQVAAILYARLVPTRYFCWAPYDTQTSYSIQATLQGRPLTPAEIRRRYRRSPQGADNRSPQHVIDILQQVEQRLTPEQQATVHLTYRVNGKQEQHWQWPLR
jgi:hypothetical protein